jgi:heme/copper-type cytochrome/quinol oxidase subunit 1
MKIKYVIIFLLGLLALAVSEYIFLTELNNQQRFYILILTSVVAIASVVTIFACYKRLRKDI